VYKFFVCYHHCHTRQPTRDVIKMKGNTLGERYECTMAWIEQIARADYKLEVQW